MFIWLFAINPINYTWVLLLCYLIYSLYFECYPQSSTKQHLWTNENLNVESCLLLFVTYRLLMNIVDIENFLCVWSSPHLSELRPILYKSNGAGVYLPLDILFENSRNQNELYFMLQKTKYCVVNGNLNPTHVHLFALWYAICNNQKKELFFLSSYKKKSLLIVIFSHMRWTTRGVSFLNGIQTLILPLPVSYRKCFTVLLRVFGRQIPYRI